MAGNSKTSAAFAKAVSQAVQALEGQAKLKLDSDASAQVETPPGAKPRARDSDLAPFT